MFHKVLYGTLPFIHYLPLMFFVVVEVIDIVLIFGTPFVQNRNMNLHTYGAEIGRDNNIVTNCGQESVAKSWRVTSSKV